MASIMRKTVLEYANDIYEVGDIISFETKDGTDYYCVLIDDLRLGDNGSMQIDIYDGEKMQTIDVNTIKG